PELPPQAVSTGLPTLVVPVGEAAAVARAVPDLEAVAALLDRCGARSFYLAHCEPERGRARARMFSGLVGGGEDPATGSAAGPLCAYLAERAGEQRVEIVQGVEMGRPSRILCELEGDRVRVGGGVVLVVEGEVLLGG
ncbi:MAG TPA: PhzF family phenazine biosynthesis isomerase, partial [Thermoleophilaceae bacterium]|nr:PhzF family phenazine biosynthesis isomerase [Thermoleophilaceae bacterium]